MDQVRVMLYIKNNYKKISDKDVLHKCEGIPYVDTKVYVDYLKSQKSADMGPWYLRGFEWKKYQKKHGR